MAGRVISERLRAASVEAYLKGGSIYEIADAAGVGYESVRRWIKSAGHSTSKKRFRKVVASSDNDVVGSDASMGVRDGNIKESVREKRTFKKNSKGGSRCNLRWTPDEDEVLKDAVLTGMTVDETADLLSRTKSAIYGRKLILIGRKVIPDPDTRFNMPDGIKRNRMPKVSEPIVESVIVPESVEVPVETPVDRVPTINVPELSDLAKIVKEYGVNVTLNLTSSGMEVRMTS